MEYNPRIFIRGYTATDYRLLVNPGEFEVATGVARLSKQSVLFAGDNPGIEGIKLSGDAQSGSDVVLLSGDETGALQGTTTTRFRVNFNPAFLFLGKILQARRGSFSVTASQARLNRSRKAKAETGLFNVTGNQARLSFDRLLRTAAGTFTVTFNPATLTANVGAPDDPLVLLSGDQQGGFENLILSGDAQSGSDRLKVSFATLTAQSAAITVTFNQARLIASQAGPMLASGDAQSGSDHIVLSGDAQSGGDRLITSKT